MHKVNAGYTLLVRVKPESVEAASASITEMNAHPEQLPFERTTTTHFATVTVIPEQVYCPETLNETLPPTLMFATSHCGPVRYHVRELVRVMGASLRKLLAHCEGFDPHCLDGELEDFMLANRQPSTFYSAMTDLSPEDVRRHRQLRDAIEGYIDEQQAKGGMTGTPAAVRREIQDFVRSRADLAWAQEPFAPGPWAWFVFHWRSLVVEASVLALLVATVVKLFVTSAVLGAFVIAGWIALALFVAFVIALVMGVREAEREQQFVSVRQSDEFVRALAATQGRPVINEFTLAGPIKEGILRPLFLRLSLWIIARVVEGVPGMPYVGTGIDIPTVATARWIPTDDGRRLMFISNFTNDGVPYVRDFIETRGGAMRINLSFGFGRGFPKTRWAVLDGAVTDPNAYLYALSDHQRTTMFWYCPYRDISIDNIKLNRVIREGLFADLDDRQAQGWLLGLELPKKQPNEANDKPNKPKRKPKPSFERLELPEIQGLVLRGYGTLRAARFFVLSVEDDRLAREYLRGLDINCGQEPAEVSAIQVAFTAKGLEALKVPDSALRTFSREFIEGMDEPVRSDALGDRYDNDPSKWEWGRKAEAVHVLLMVYALDADVMKAVLKHELGSESPSGVILGGAFRVLHDKHTQLLEGQKEHFGWTDGLSMPVIGGVDSNRPRKKKPAEQKQQQTWTEPLPGGEFVLGYRNDYGAWTESPTVDPDDDPAGHLPLDRDGIHRSLGRNGSYLVYREMTQDVIGLWSYLETESRERGADAAERAIALGAKMVGRWPGGAPLITSPDLDDPDRATDNKFQYEHDKAGVLCPAGAHIRRANPRDVLAPDRDAETSRQMVRKHQMIRRGRPFGPPVVASMDPHEILAARDTPIAKQRRGLHFICLVGDIRRQFEFPQRAWIYSPVFAALSRDGDPISAGRRPGDNRNDEFTCPAHPVRRRYTTMPQFTTLIGGGYFFLPSLTALRFIARELE